MNIEHILDNLRPKLSPQAPIKDFIHLNTLRGFQHHPFDEGVLLGSELFGARAYMPLKFYRDAYKEGKVSDEQLRRSAEQPSPILWQALFHFIEIHDDKICRNLPQIASTITELNQRLSAHASKKSRPYYVDSMGGDWDLQINPIIFRLLAGFLDQGIGLSPFPDAELGFFKAIEQIAQHSTCPLASFINKKGLLSQLAQTPEAVCLELLPKLCHDRNYESYITETLMAHPGWSAMVNIVEQRPESLLKVRKIRLIEFLAFKLIVEWEFIQSCHPVHALRPADKTQTLAMSIAYFLHTQNIRLEDIDPDTLLKLNEPSLGKIWHHAFEFTYHDDILQKIQGYARQNSNLPTTTPEVQAVFCIDVRECSFRRHLESIDPRVETLATAGFFGIDFFFQSINDAIPKQNCPAPLKPQHLVKERPLFSHHEEFERQKRLSEKTAISLQRWHDASGSMLLGFIAANTLGHLSFFKLIASLFKPKLLLKSLASKQIDVATELTLHRDADEQEDHSLHHGFTNDEMTERVFSVLTSIGLTSNFAPLVVIMSHGSSSVNNPHFAAYECGACSGKPGAPNARAFAAMANIPEVRAQLADQGITIPKSTRFLGAYHDTCTEHVFFFDAIGLTNKQRSILDQFTETLKQAQGLNAQERCSRFAIVDPHISPQEALIEVAHRASALFEPRPELGSARNTMCIVGPRSTTKGLSLDGRSYLNSYNPFADPDGHILNQILSAVIPVCGGINLSYFFSRLDNAIYGSGTKLSHNVCALLGVYNGIDDDLRTGLPIQATEIHDPIRLLALIEQKAEIVDKVIRSNAPVFEWVNNGWVKMACLDPVTRELSMFKNGRWIS